LGMFRLVGSRYSGQLNTGLINVIRNAAARYIADAWASAHRGKWGQLTPWKMDEN